jgi:hypothetical protein
MGLKDTLKRCIALLSTDGINSKAQVKEILKEIVGEKDGNTKHI